MIDFRFNSNKKYEREVHEDVSLPDSDAAGRVVSGPVAGWNSGDGRAQHCECVEHQTSTLWVHPDEPGILRLFPGDSPLASVRHLLKGDPGRERATVPVPGAGRAQNNFLPESLEQSD